MEIFSILLPKKIQYISITLVDGQFLTSLRKDDNNDTVLARYSSDCMMQWYHTRGLHLPPSTVVMDESTD